MPTTIETVQVNPVSILPGTQGAYLLPDFRVTLGFTRQGWPIVMDSSSRYGFTVEDAGIAPFDAYRQIVPGTDWNLAYCLGSAWVERQVDVKILRPDGEQTPLQVTFRRESRARNNYFPDLSVPGHYTMGSTVLDWEDSVTIRHIQPSGGIGQVREVSNTSGRLTQYIPHEMHAGYARDSAICYMTAFGDTSDLAYGVSAQQFGEMVAVYVDWVPNLAEGKRFEFVIADFGVQPLRQVMLQELTPTGAFNLIEPLWRFNPPVTVDSARGEFLSRVVRIT